MNFAQKFRTVDAWRVALGLLPVPLRAREDNREQYVLLNGTTGNFCLDFIGGVERKSQRDAAWSCDVGHYITCVDDSIVVNRWDKQSTDETYSIRSVTNQLHEFHRHLEKTSPDRSRNIVAHVLRVFRQIRTAVADQNNALHSLRILLHLLASAAADQHRLNTELDVWGLTPEIIESSRAVPEATWFPLYNDLAGMGRTDDLRPDLQLVPATHPVLFFKKLMSKLSFTLHLHSQDSSSPYLLAHELRQAKQVFISHHPHLLAHWQKRQLATSQMSRDANLFFLIQPADRPSC